MASTSMIKYGFCAHFALIRCHYETTPHMVCRGSHSGAAQGRLRLPLRNVAEGHTAGSLRSGPLVVDFLSQLWILVTKGFSNGWDSFICIIYTYIYMSIYIICIYIYICAAGWLNILQRLKTPLNCKESLQLAEGLCGLMFQFRGHTLRVQLS